MKITAIYGLRRSEVLGLKWDSIDFDTGTVTIRHTVSKVTKAVEKDKTKNATSYRSFPLTNEARSIFQAAKTEEQKNRRLFGKEYVESDYVFKWPDGHSYSPDYITEKFPALLKKHGMPHIRLHELRHPNVKPKTKSFSTFFEIFQGRTLRSYLGRFFIVQVSYGA